MSGELLCIILGPSVVLRTEDAGIRWCFGCRARLLHVGVLLDDEVQPSYYDPIWVRRCSRCGKDRTTFPGTQQ